MEQIDKVTLREYLGQIQPSIASMRPTEFVCNDGFKNLALETLKGHDWSKTVQKPVQIDFDVQNGISFFDVVISWEDEGQSDGRDYLILDILQMTDLMAKSKYPRIYLQQNHNIFKTYNIPYQYVNESDFVKNGDQKEAVEKEAII